MAKAKQPKKPRTASNIGRQSQKVGRQWQKLVAKSLAEATGLDPREFYSNSGGTFGDDDVHSSEEARRAWPFHTETKCTKNLQVSQWLLKLDHDCLGAEDDAPGIIVFKRPLTRRAYCVVEFGVLLDLLYGPLSSDKQARITEILKGDT